MVGNSLRWNQTVDGKSTYLDRKTSVHVSQRENVTVPAACYNTASVDELNFVTLARREVTFAHGCSIAPGP